VLHNIVTPLDQRGSSPAEGIWTPGRATTRLARGDKEDFEDTIGINHLYLFIRIVTQKREVAETCKRFSARNSARPSG
jgi:hypothetical protein